MRFGEKLIDAGDTRVAMSIHAHNARIEDAITQRKGSFKEKIEAIKQLVATRDRGHLNDGFSLNVVLHKKILSHLDDLVAFFKDKGVIDIRFNFIRPEHQAVGSTTWVPTFKQTAPKILQLIACNQAEYRLMVTFADIPLCQLPWELLSNNTLRQYYMGELYDLSTDVALYSPGTKTTRHFNWKQQRMSLLKCHLHVCQSCSLQKKCEGIWKSYLDIHGMAEFDDGPAQAEACTTGML